MSSNSKYTYQFNLLASYVFQKDHLPPQVKSSSVVIKRLRDPGIESLVKRDSNNLATKEKVTPAKCPKIVWVDRFREPPTKMSEPRQPKRPMTIVGWTKMEKVRIQFDF